MVNGKLQEGVVQRTSSYPTSRSNGAECRWSVGTEETPGLIARPSKVWSVDDDEKRLKAWAVVSRRRNLATIIPPIIGKVLRCITPPRGVPIGDRTAIGYVPQVPERRWRPGSGALSDGRGDKVTGSNLACLFCRGVQIPSRGGGGVLRGAAPDAIKKPPNDAAQTI
jgi:hypothetical protein